MKENFSPATDLSQRTVAEWPNLPLFNAQSSAGLLLNAWLVAPLQTSAPYSQKGVLPEPKFSSRLMDGAPLKITLLSGKSKDHQISVVWTSPSSRQLLVGSPDYKAWLLCSNLFILTQTELKRSWKRIIIISGVYWPLMKNTIPPTRALHSGRK